LKVAVLPSAVNVAQPCFALSFADGAPKRSMAPCLAAGFVRGTCFT